MSASRSSLPSHRLKLLPPQTQSLPAGPLNVLVVDDNAVNRELLSRMLTRLDHHPVLANDGYRAAELAARQRFDLVLTDIRMDGLDGVPDVSGNP